ncbi:MFS transporter [Pseudonocardia sp. NPDC049154]|uniref:MFS transporter n=1 Tax=Pseudonocardia sp. NPDC049154 TaxID=3155501 RepID=UPI0033E31E07
MDDIVTIRREIDHVPLRPFHWKVLALVMLAVVFDGIDALVPAYAIPFLEKDWGLSAAQSGLLVSAGLVGIAVGALLHGPIADRTGRRPALLAGMLISGVFSVATAALATGPVSFMSFRVLTGFGLGVILPIAIAYLNEFLPVKVRNRLAILGAAGFSVGGIVAGLFGVYAVPELGWHSLFYIGGVTIVLAAVYPFVLPESPEWLASRGRAGEARAVLDRVAPADVRAAAVAAAVPAPVDSANAGPGHARRDWRLPLRPEFLGRTLALWYSAFLLLFVAYGITGWAPTLLIERGFTMSAGFALSATLQALSLIGGLLGAYLADRWLGTRNLLILWGVLGALTVFVTGIAGTGALTAVAVALTGMFVHGGLYVLYNVCAQTYPVEARSTGQGLMIGVGRWGAVLGPAIGGALLGVLGSKDDFFIVLAVITLLAVAGLFAIRTTGRQAAAVEERPATTVPAGEE